MEKEGISDRMGTHRKNTFISRIRNSPQKHMRHKAFNSAAMAASIFF